MDKIVAIVLGWLLFIVTASVVGAATETPYTYMKFSLRVPWTLYFVFLLCISIPFLVMIFVAWRSKGEKVSDENEQNTRTSDRAIALRKFARYFLPLLLVAVYAATYVFVLNAFQATHLMETEKRVGPTLLNNR